jgi:hypothetical protein
MTMSQDWDKRPDVGDSDGSATGGTAERYYMNKAYGRSLEKARALDSLTGGNEGGEFQRATIEPEADGGHKVIVEHSTTVVAGGGDGRDVARSEHSFSTPEDAIQFLREVLRGRLPGGVRNGSHAHSGRGSEPGDDGSGDPIADVLGEAGGRG